MEFLLLILLVLCLVLCCIAFNKYNPKLDLVKSGNKYILFFWYNKFNWGEEYEGRRYIKLFEI